MSRLRQMRTSSRRLPSQLMEMPRFDRPGLASVKAFSMASADSVEAAAPEAIFSGSLTASKAARVAEK
ncbi:hypothetical protein D3C78_1345460 [compost metagenome]